MTAAQVDEWLGFDARTIEDILPQLLQLRALTREGRMPTDREPFGSLHHVLRGHYMSLRTVLLNEDLFRQACQELCEPTS